MLYQNNEFCTKMMKSVPKGFVPKIINLCTKNNEISTKNNEFCTKNNEFCTNLKAVPKIMKSVPKILNFCTKIFFVLFISKIL